MNCKCVLTMADIAAEAGKLLNRQVSLQTARFVRAELAQQHCDKMFAGKPKDWEAGCINNPYLPTKVFGNTYGFSRARANRIIRAIVARSKSKYSIGAVRRWQGPRAVAFA